MSLTREELIRNLKDVKKREYGKEYLTFQTDVYQMASDILEYLENEKNYEDENEHLQSQLLEYQRVCKQKQSIIDELRSNPSFKFDDLDDFTSAFDSQINEWCLIKKSFAKDKIYVWYFCEDEAFIISKDDFEENRFYKKEAD